MEQDYAEHFLDKNKDDPEQQQFPTIQYESLDGPEEKDSPGYDGLNEPLMGREERDEEEEEKPEPVVKLGCCYSCRRCCGWTLSKEVS